MLRDQHPINRPNCCEEHREEYRDVQFAVRRMGPGMPLSSALEGGHERLLMGQYFMRYLTNDELCDTSGQDMPKAIQAMRNGIDRLHTRSPIYTGDIRYRFSADN
jgi:hypothetical protein